MAVKVYTAASIRSTSSQALSPVAAWQRQPYSVLKAASGFLAAMEKATAVMIESLKDVALCQDYSRI